MGTINVSAITSSFTLASAGACMIDVMEPGTIRIWIGTAQPPANVAAYFVLGYNEKGFPYTGTENVYVMSNDGATHLCVVDVTL